MSLIVVMSTSESELIGACACEQEIQFSRKLTVELGFRQHAPTPLFEDHLEYELYHSHRAWAFHGKVKAFSPSLDVYL